MSTARAPARILHLHSSFDTGSREQRLARLMGAFGRDAEHAIVADDPARRSGASLIDPKMKVAWPAFPPLTGRPTLGRLKRLAQAMAGYDLICTYNRGAIDAALAHTLFADVFKLPPLVHHEDGSGDGENWWRNFRRRIALGRSAALVVPSRMLEQIALNVWQQPRTRVRLIPDGIATRAFATAPRRDALPRLVKHKGELWIGTLASLRVAEDLPLLVRAFSRLPDEWQLVIIGEGPEREVILAQAVQSGVEHRVHLPGLVAEPARAVPLLDIFALSSRSGQAPVSVVQAMAAKLPVAAPRIGDVGAIVASENGPFLCDPGDEEGLASALATLAADPGLRLRVGQANRARARAEFDEARMIERYRALYWGLMGRK